MALLEQPHLHKSKSGKIFLSYHAIRVKYHINMKFSAILIAGLNSAAGEPPKGHLKRLQGLVRGTTEILNSGAFNRKPESWIKMWEQKIITNAERIEKRYHRANEKCGEGDRKRRDTVLLEFSIITHDTVKGSSRID